MRAKRLIEMENENRNENARDSMNCSRISVMSVLERIYSSVLCVEALIAHAIIPKNRSASSIAFSLSGGQISIFALSDFALL